jgi:hypothetical protein
VHAARPRRLYQGLGFIVVLYFAALAVVFWRALDAVPIEPLLVLFAAVGFDDARRRVPDARARPARDRRPGAWGA